MHIIHNTKVDNWIYDYNRRLALKDADFFSLMRRIMISLVLNTKNEVNQKVEKVVTYTEKKHTLNVTRNGLGDIIYIRYLLTKLLLY